ncbi:HEAT repeat-containing protein [Thermoplasmatales archaeon SCGC AB-540-F20]|nr:HEAT repeat-containing protein [Thermoplasmatales archaeon SCGC AB-540-F20]
MDTLRVIQANKNFHRPLIRVSNKGEYFLTNYKKTGQNTEAKQDKVYELGLNPKIENIQTLIEYTKSENGNHRRLAASALGKLSHMKPEIYHATPALIELLKDKHPQIRQYSVKALGKIGDKRAIPFLEEIEKNDEKEYNRDSAKNALYGLKS